MTTDGSRARSGPGDATVDFDSALTMGEAAIRRREIDAAVTHFRRATRIAERAGLEVHAGRARMSLAEALAGRGDFAGADRETERATTVLRGGDLARFTAQRANIDYYRGRLVAALEGYRQALPGLRRAGDVFYEAIAIENRGLILAHQGSFAAAVADLERSAVLLESIGEHRLAADVEVNLGWLAARTGDVPAALARFDKADEFFRLEGDTDPAALFDRCEALLAAHLAVEARRTAAEAVTRLGEQGVATLVAEANLRLSEAALLDGDTPAAAAAAEAALRRPPPAPTELRRPGPVRIPAGGVDGGRPVPPPGRPRSAGGRGPGCDRLGRRRPRRPAHRRPVGAGGGARRSGAGGAGPGPGGHRRRPAQLRSRLWHAEALLRLADGDRRGADSALRAGIRVLETHRAILGASELRAHTSAHGADLARLGVRLALEDERPERVLRWAERWRAGSLHLRPARPPADAALAAELVELRNVSAQLAEAATDGRGTAALLTRQASIENAVQHRTRHAPGDGLYRSLPAPTVRMFHDALGDRALVELVECDGDLHAVVLAGGRLRLHRLGPLAAVERELHGLRFALRRIAHRYGSPKTLRATHDSREHAGPERSTSFSSSPWPRTPVGELVVVPTGVLHSVPWSLLPSCTGRPVSVAPSAAIWYRAMSTAAAPIRPESRVALIAGPGLPGRNLRHLIFGGDILRQNGWYRRRLASVLSWPRSTARTWPMWPPTGISAATTRSSRASTWPTAPSPSTTWKRWPEPRRRWCSRRATRGYRRCARATS